MLQHLDAADHRARRRAWTGRRTSSASTSSAPSTRCRWSRSSAARRPPTRRWPRPTTSCSRSGRRRSSSTTAAASTPRGSSASWSTRGWRCSPRASTRCRLERAATQAGYPVGTLQLSDELNMELMAKIGKAAQDAAERDGTPYEEHPAAAVVRTMIELGRTSRLKGAGFYDYDDERAAAGPVVRPGRGVPAERGADPAARRAGPDALRRGARDRRVLRGGRHRVGGRGQHRLDHGHRLPARDRRRGPVHDRLPGPRRPDRRDRAGRVRPARRPARRALRRAVPALGVPPRPGRARASPSPPERTVPPAPPVPPPGQNLHFQAELRLGSAGFPGEPGNHATARRRARSAGGWPP